MKGISIWVCGSIMPGSDVAAGGVEHLVPFRPCSISMILPALD